MKKLFLSLASFCLLACSSADFDDSSKVSPPPETNNTPNPTVQLSIKQAEAYAKLFSPSFISSDEQEENHPNTRKSRANVGRTINNINYLIEHGDTLLYAINYSNNEGFILLSGANNSFPIIAHASTGNIYLSEITPDNPLSLTIETYKEIAQKAIQDPNAIYSSYFDEWKDLGKEGYEYEIELTNGEPEAEAPSTRSGRRRESSKKKSIYPYTGKELNYWSQEGGYNFYAPNKYPIGCPAIAIGMLMYDTSERVFGNHQETVPAFSYTDQKDIRQEKGGTELAQKLRQIADSIPRYGFGPSASGANPQDILIGLRKLGYTKAQLKPYSFEKLYENMRFKGQNISGGEMELNRGVLIGAYSIYGGHIWFCDGYYEQSYRVRKRFLGIKRKSWTEYDDRIYMNWGWGPNGGNGWYSASESGVWSPSDSKNRSNYFKINPQIYTNLTHYEYPKNSH